MLKLGFVKQNNAEINSTIATEVNHKNTLKRQITKNNTEIKIKIYSTTVVKILINKRNQIHKQDLITYLSVRTLLILEVIFPIKYFLSEVSQ